MQHWRWHMHEIVRIYPYSKYLPFFNVPPFLLSYNPSPLIHLLNVVLLRIVLHQPESYGPSTVTVAVERGAPKQPTGHQVPLVPVAWLVSCQVVDQCLRPRPPYPSWSPIGWRIFAVLPIVIPTSTSGSASLTSNHSLLPFRHVCAATHILGCTRSPPRGPLAGHPG